MTEVFESDIPKCRECKRDVLGCACGPGKMDRVQHRDYWNERGRFLGLRYVGRLEWTEDELADDTRRHIERICPFLPDPPASIFEYGAGWGRMLLPLCDLGYDATGVDMADSAVEMAREHGAKVGLLGDHPIPRGCDVAMTSVCLQHIPQGAPMEGAVATLRAALKSGGTLILWENTSVGKKATHSFIEFRPADFYRDLFPDFAEVFRSQPSANSKGESHTLLVLRAPS